MAIGTIRFLANTSAGNQGSNTKFQFDLFIDRFRRFGFLRHAASIDRKISTFNPAERLGRIGESRARDRDGSPDHCGW
jgi:hypothetical protein